MIRTGNLCYVTISDLALAKSFFNVSVHSDKIYYRRKLRSLWVEGDNAGNFVDTIATLPHGWYSSSQLATVLTNAMTTANVGGPTVTVSFETSTQQLRFQERAGGFGFLIMRDEDLMQTENINFGQGNEPIWTHGAMAASQIESINNLISTLNPILANGGAGVDYHGFTQKLPQWNSGDAGNYVGVFTLR